MLKSRSVNDFDFISELHQGLGNSLGVTENATVPKNKNKENYRPRTLIDETLELIDPTPNIHTLFVQFNVQFFRNVLLPVEVKWSNRMTSCAGTCTFHPRNRQCIITLSSPLLKLRPRKDLVETLLHEMIHGYLFLTNNNRDRDGHGPEFCKHMHRINKEAGTNITIYHDFHEEVKLYKQHWWKCNGPCRSRAPYFGTVRRAMNRAPGPSDFWWKDHQRSCGGEFVKIKEPVKQNIMHSQKSGEKVKAPSKDVYSNKKILSWLVNNVSTLTSTIDQSPKPFRKSDILGKNKFENYKDNIDDRPLATKAIAAKHENYLHSSQGWNTDSPSKTSSQSKQITSNAPTFSCSGSIGGKETGRSNLLSKFKNPLLNSVKNVNCERTEIVTKSHKDHKANLAIKAITEFVRCPKCDTAISSNNINKHLDTCLISEDKRSDTFQTFTDAVFPGSISPYTKETTKPLASTSPSNSNSTQKRKSSITKQSSKQPKLDFEQSSNVVRCPICQKDFPFLHINVHLDKCLSEVGTNLNSDKVCINSNDWKVKNQVSLRNLSDNDSTDCVIVESPSTSLPSKTTIQNNAHNCLICNAAIASDISLTDHLEECIGTIFNDDSTTLFEGDTLEAKEIPVMEKNVYPCPVCMRWLPETSMNDHLDRCLTDN